MEAVARIAAILRYLGSNGSRGARLSDIADAVLLARSTTHRILKSLEEERLVQRHPGTGQYQLGDDVALLGHAVTANALQLTNVAEPVVQHLADITGDTTYLSVRSGMESVCVLRCFGPFPIKTLTIDTGSRRPLGVGAGGLAFMAALSKSEINRVMAHILPNLERFPGFAAPLIPQLISATQARGYSYSDGQIAAGVRGIGIAILNSAHEPVGALSLAAISKRIEGKRLDTLLRNLFEQKVNLERAVRNAGY